MVNNKKVKTVKDKKVNRNEAAASADTLSSFKTLSHGKFHLLILICLGLSRLLEWRRASLELEKPIDDFVSTNTTSTCATYLDTDACQDTGVQTLIHLKYVSSILVIGLVLITMMHVWHFETTLCQFNALLLTSPVATGLYALVASRDMLNTGTIQSLALMGVVLVVLARPTEWAHLPFAGQPAYVAMRSFAGMTLLCVAAICATLAFYLVGGPEYQGTEWISANLAPLAMNEASRVLTRLLAVDALTVCCICGFCYYHMPHGFQQVSDNAV
jgi:hypothetical protein